MFLRTFNEGEPFRCAGNNYVMLLPRDFTGCCEVVLEKVAPGHATPPNAHETFLQVYILLEGQADVFIGEEKKSVIAPAVALIPRNTKHFVINTSSDRQLQYLYMSVWPNGIPRSEIEGGWQKVYQQG